MNYLTICQDAQRECDITGTQIASVLNNVGELLRLVNWVKQAWTEIQGKHENWRWMRSRFTVQTAAADDEYAPTDCTDSRLAAAVSRFARWLIWDDRGLSNVKIYLTSSGVGTEHYLPFMDWSSFQATYKTGTQNDSYPACFTIDPQNNLVLGPRPNGIYTVSGEYQMSAQILAADADVPEMPARFHSLIVYEAMKKFARFENAPDVMSGGVIEGNRVWRQLEGDQLPDIALAEPLA